MSKGTLGPAPCNFVGPKPLSEPESLAIYNFTSKNNFKLVIALHSQGKEIYWNYQNINPPKGYEIGKKFSEIRDRKSTRLNSSHKHRSRMPSSA